MCESLRPCIAVTWFRPWPFLKRVILSSIETIETHVICRQSFWAIRTREITLNVEGGNGHYSFSWSQKFLKMDPLTGLISEAKILINKKHNHTLTNV